MRFKITYGEGPRLDVYGYFLPVQPVPHEQYAETYKEAVSKAFKISCKHKKWIVNIYDLQGPALKEFGEEGKFSTWWCCSFKAKKMTYSNDNYRRNT